MDKYADVEAEAGEITSSQEHRLLHSSFIVAARDRVSTSTPNAADPPRNASPAPSLPRRRAVLKYPASSASEGRWNGKKKIRALPKSTRGVRISCADSPAEEHRGGNGDLGVSEGRQPSLTTDEIREPEAVAREQPTVPQPSLAADEIREPSAAASTEHLADPQPSLTMPEIIEPESASREQPAEPQPSLTTDEIREPGAASREHLSDPQPSLEIIKPEAASREQPADQQRSLTADEIRESGTASREHLSVPLLPSLTMPEIIEPEAASREQPADPQPSLLTADGTREPAAASIEHPATSKGPSLPEESNDGAGCSTEFPEEDDIPPLTLLEALKILTPDPRRIFAETDTLEFLRSLGIDVPPPK